MRPQKEESSKLQANQPREGKEPMSYSTRSARTPLQGGTKTKGILHIDTVQERVPEETRGAQMASPIVFVCSQHPLALDAILLALKSDLSLYQSVKSSHDAPTFVEALHHAVVLLDIHSLPDWKKTIPKWIVQGIRPIAIISCEMEELDTELDLVSSGICGIVTLVPKYAIELRMAIHFVARGDLWIKPGIMQEYSKRMADFSNRIPGTMCLLTAREKQILGYLIRRLSNKQISSILLISERTVKFHVSNILGKTKTPRRRQLIELAQRTGQRSVTDRLHSLTC
jgi:DNA-binding NarL/FixJ family response regulator